MPPASDSRFREPGTVKNPQLLRIGIIGTVVAALCCFTPILVLGLGAVGLSAWLGWLDYVLLPALVVFLAITLIAVARLRRGPATTGPAGNPEE